MYILSASVIALVVRQYSPGLGIFPFEKELRTRGLKSPLRFGFFNAARGFIESVSDIFHF